MRRATSIGIGKGLFIGVSIHARHATGDRHALGELHLVTTFQFTPVMRRATSSSPVNTTGPTVSIHARHATGDPTLHLRHTKATPCFNSRPSCDGRLEFMPLINAAGVSIHARHATGDAVPGGLRAVELRVSIHARHATGDFAFCKNHDCTVFQFTPVMRRATFSSSPNLRPCRFQFTPVMRRATRKRRAGMQPVRVSIHARHATGDTSRCG